MVPLPITHLIHFIRKCNLLGACNIYARSGDATGMSWLRVGHGPAVGCAATKWTGLSAVPATRALPVQRRAGVPPVLAASCFRPQCAATSSPNLKGLGHRVGPGWYQSGAGVERGCKVPFSVLRMLMEATNKRRQKTQVIQQPTSNPEHPKTGQSHPKPGNGEGTHRHGWPLGNLIACNFRAVRGSVWVGTRKTIDYDSTYRYRGSGGRRVGFCLLQVCGLLKRRVPIDQQPVHQRHLRQCRRGAGG